MSDPAPRSCIITEGLNWFFFNVIKPVMDELYKWLIEPWVEKYG